MKNDEEELMFVQLNVSEEYQLRAVPRSGHSIPVTKGMLREACEQVGIPACGADGFCKDAQNDCAELKRQRDAAVARAEEVEEELAGLRKAVKQAYYALLGQLQELDE